MKVQAQKIEKGKWYLISYRRKKNKFVGAAKCVAIGGNGGFYRDGEYVFISPLDECEAFKRHMIFHLKDIVRPCNPLPSYKKLLRIYNKCFLDMGDTR